MTFLLLRVVLGAVFFAAGVIKIWDFHQGAWATPAFYEDIANYHLLESSDAVMLAAVYLPWLELIVGGALLFGRATAGAAALCAGLLLVFIAALASAWSRGLDISCGCFGHENATANFPLLLARDCALLLCAVALAWRERLRISGPSPARRAEGN
ncbi:MAG TPA: MauE/DoxX family redox-associated membrane protein [Chthoniobacteraceae bacterium]|nr:MauE/DoxX family redox-associated membrane protein [Chthoniobacteraceae bacterium]